MKPKHVLIFIIANVILIGGVFSFGISPGMQNISRLDNAVRRQESQMALRRSLALAYEDNLQTLQELENRQLCEHDVMFELSKIYQLTHANNLQTTTFVIGEQIGFDRIDELHITRTNASIESEGNIADILNFLRELEETSSDIITVGIVWRDGSRARINIELTVLSANI